MSSNTVISGSSIVISPYNNSTFTSYPTPLIPPTATVTYWPPITSTGPLVLPSVKKIYSMKSPRSDAPYKVFLDGRFLAFGLIGSKGTEYTFMNNTIMFCNLIPYGHIALEFKNEIYNYHFDWSEVVPKFNLVSVVKTGP